MDLVRGYTLTKYILELVANVIDANDWLMFYKLFE
jgi:hypothetical protein